MPDAAPYSPEPLHVSLWRNPPRFAASHIVATLAGTLALDAALGWPGQLAGNAWTVSVFAWLLRHGGGPEKRALLACLVLAGLGEAFLSLVWGLYDYQFHNIPVFVPPGHALLMTLGILAARRSPRLPVWLVPAMALPYVALGLWQGWDTFGALLMLMFMICLAKGEARRLYATMFVLSLALELYGTWLGNWTWRPLVPVLSASNTNPPLCSGAFYCVLDVLVLASVSFAAGGWRRLLTATRIPRRLHGRDQRCAAQRAPQCLTSASAIFRAKGGQHGRDGREAPRQRRHALSARSAHTDGHGLLDVAGAVCGGETGTGRPDR